ncbi:MAG: dihydrolipoyl dehydrogenase [Deltaproteobacteria bacterium]|nr:dihydrolipoyl dehydrogenase [Deltaproteobacteria bacterium]
MDTLEVDVAIIGAGSAGLPARRAALKHGRKVVLIEHGPYGTTCARVGCMPSKLLIAAADAAHDIGRAKTFGIEAKQIAIDGAAVLDRVRRERDRFAGFVVGAVDEIPAEQKLRGTARFTGPTRLEVRDEAASSAMDVRARSVVIATGSSPWNPPVLDAAGDRLLQNDDVFELETLPESIAVVGTGIIGLELGQALHRLGVRTSFFDISDLVGPVTDPVIKDKVRAVLGAELDLHLQVQCQQVEPDGDGVRLRWTDADGTRHSEHFDRVLAATGRRPNLATLNLAATGLELGPNGVPVYDPRTMQCGQLPIFIAGDVSADRPLLHEASDEGHIAGENAALFPNVQAMRRRTPLAIVFVDPQIAMAGQSYAELKAAGVDFEIGEVSFDDQGRARTMARNSGHLRIYGKWQCGSILGAEMIGPQVEHLAHLLAWTAQTGSCVGQVLGMPFYHPVVEEGVRTALRDLADKLKMRCAADPLCDGAGS